jgi:hypothetical protein
MGNFRMGYRLKAAAAALAIAFLAACADPMGRTTKELTKELEVDLEFGIKRLQTEPAFVVNAGTGEITIRGYYVASCGGYTATARAQLTDNHLTLYVHGVQPSGCRQSISSVGYQATIRAVPAGTYDVDAAHTYPTNKPMTQITLASQVVVR